MGRIVGKQVGEKHKAAEIIINTGKVPEEWSNKLEKRFSSASKAAKNPAKVSRIQEQAKEAALKRLDHLIDYFKASSLVKDKETRGILLDQLQRARRVWKEKEWNEIITSRKA